MLIAVHNVIDRQLLTQASQHLTRCMLCEHRCGVDRLNGQRGPCKAGPIPRLFRHRVEYGEELELVPSHLFYLSGCDLRCVFCIAGLNAFDPARGQDLTPELFQEAVAWGQAQGARNIQWVGGEPTIHIPAILQLMADCPNLPPVVWKSDFYGTPDAFDLLKGVANVYVADFKFGNDQCARTLAGVNNYVRIVQRNLALVAGQGRLIVRHLLLPGHDECCYRPVAAWLRENLPDVPLSLRDGYMPSWRSNRHGELARPLEAGASRDAHAFAAQIGLKVVQ